MKKPGDIFQDIMSVPQLDPADLGPCLPKILPSSKIKSTASFYSTAAEGRKSERASNFGSNAPEYFKFQKGLR